MATVAELRRLLGGTTMPAPLAKTLLAGASPLWLSSDSALDLAEDLALCHPPLGPAEVRARATATPEDGWRLTVAAQDRRGLLADTAAILAAAGYSVLGASVATWSSVDLALHALTIAGPTPSDAELEHLGASLRAAGTGHAPPVIFHPTGRAFVRHSGDANGDRMITVVAPDQPGLLAAICRWLAEHDVSIEAAWIAGEEEANDVFIVTDEVDVAALERRLTAQDDSVAGFVTRLPGQMVDAAATTVRSVLDLASGLVGRPRS